MENIGYLWSAITRDWLIAEKWIIYHFKEDTFNFLMILSHCFYHIHKCIYCVPQNEDFTRRIFPLSTNCNRNNLTSHLENWDIYLVIYKGCVCGILKPDDNAQLSIGKVTEVNSAVGRSFGKSSHRCLVSEDHWITRNRRAKNHISPWNHILPHFNVTVLNALKQILRISLCCWWWL